MEHDQIDRIERRQALWEDLVVAEQELLTALGAGPVPGADGPTGEHERVTDDASGTSRVAELAEDLHRLNREASAAPVSRTVLGSRHRAA